jgi:hypothetical protein
MPDFGIMRGFNDKLFGDKLYAGQLPTQLGLIGSSDFGLKLLDLYPNAAAAYSVRKLRDAYTGSAIRVRRSSDNTETDIGFSNENLDTTALTSFCSGTNGFVTTWYDQSGNARNATQTTAANQPQIVSSGSVLTLNGKPVLNFDGTNDFLRSTFGSTLTTNLTYVASFKLLSLSNNFKNIYGNASDLVTTYLTNLNQWNLFNGLVLASGVTAQTIPYLNFTVFKIATAELFMNNVSLVSGIMPSPSTSNLDIANATGAGSREQNMSYWELVLYNSDETSNRSGIQTNINSYYAIY